MAQTNSPKKSQKAPSVVDLSTNEGGVWLPGSVPSPYSRHVRLEGVSNHQLETSSDIYNIKRYLF